jgi:hypothetical protein
MKGREQVDVRLGVEKKIGQTVRMKNCSSMDFGGRVNWSSVETMIFLT